MSYIFKPKEYNLQHTFVSLPLPDFCITFYELEEEKLSFCTVNHAVMTKMYIFKLTMAWQLAFVNMFEDFLFVFMQNTVINQNYFIFSILSEY